MAVNPLTPWQHYTQLYQQQLARLKADNSTTQLYQLSRQLMTARLALDEQPTAVLQHKPSLTPALARIEILYCCWQAYQWPHPIISLLLDASFCSSLHADFIAYSSNALPKLPALACAKVNQQNLPSNILTILSYCYATERRLASTRQQPLSALITLTEQLIAAQSTAPSSPSLLANLRQQIGMRIMMSRCELEMSLLAVIANKISLPPAMPAAPTPAVALLANQSLAIQLPVEDYSQLERYLQQQPVMATYVMQRASQLNRQQQDITQVKLAISLLGSNALPTILATGELLQQLVKLKVPNHALLQQFTQCFAAALSLLFNAELTTDKAQLLAYCLCAPLWLSPDNFLCSLVKNSPDPGRLNLPLVALISTGDYLPQLTGLLTRYQLSAWHNSASEFIHYLTRQATQLTLPSLTLLTAWQAALVTLTNTNQTEASFAPLQQLLVRLQQLAAANFSYQAAELCQLISNKTACYCPIQLNL
jgi:hypothetical protein